MGIDKYMDYEEFIKNELRPQMVTIIGWNHGNAEETKALLKKNKAKLRKPFLDKYEKNKQQVREEEEVATMEYDNNNNKKKNSILEERMFTLIEKEERKNYANRMQKLEQLHSKLCRTTYAIHPREIRSFLRNPTDFGFNYKLKSEEDDDAIDGNEETELTDSQIHP